MERKAIDAEKGHTTVPLVSETNAGTQAENEESKPGDPESEPTPKLSIVKMFRVARHQNTPAGWCVLCGAVLSTTVFKVFSLLFAILPIMKVYFGAMNLCNCPISSFIPFFLLIQGMCTLLEQVLVFANCRATKNDSDTKKTCVGGLFDFFVIIWFIVGSVYVYKIYEPNYDKDLGAYCDKTTYLFAFWSVTLIYAIVLVMVLMCCCACVCMCCIMAVADDSDTCTSPAPGQAAGQPPSTAPAITTVSRVPVTPV